MSDPASTPETPSAFDLKLAELQAKFPDAEVEVLSSKRAGRMIVRTPDEAMYSKFTSDSDGRLKAVQAATALCRRCILWPDLAVVDALFMRYPGLSTRITDTLLEKAGAGDAITLGK